MLILVNFSKDENLMKLRRGLPENYFTVIVIHLCILHVSSITPFLSRYTVPEELLGMIDNESGYTVYTLKVTGWQGLIYNHRHYYVFSAESPYFYVGHWGGPDQTNLFSWSLRLNR